MRDGIVHLVDDDAAVRDSVAFLLESAGYRVAAYARPHALLAELGTGTRMSCLVTDVRMPEMDGLQLVREARAIDPDLPIIVITGHGDVPLAVEAMKIGAADFIEKPFGDEQLIRAIRQALAATPRDTDEHAEIRRRVEQLSAREREVLQGLVDGHPNKVIAWRLNISPRTVEVYRAKAMSKMGAGSFAELVQMAILANLRFAPSLVPREPGE
jgi:two-component system, LuxR family, response regulator FixJ